MIAFDLDGTILSKWWTQEEEKQWPNTNIWNEANHKDDALTHKIRVRMNTVIPLLIPTCPHIIITARPEVYRYVTLKVLKEHRITPLSLLMPKTRLSYDAIPYWKAILMIKNGIDIYYEDEEYIIENMSAILHGEHKLILHKNYALRYLHAKPVEKVLDKHESHVTK